MRKKFGFEKIPELSIISAFDIGLVKIPKIPDYAVLYIRNFEMVTEDSEQIGNP